MQQPNNITPSPALTGWKARLLVVCFGLFPFILVEAVLWMSGYQSHTRFENTSSHIQVLHAVDSQVELTPERDVQFRTQPFPAIKPPDTVRIMAVGDSVTAGFIRLPQEEGYAFAEQAYPERLESLLAADTPDRNIEVINCGGCGYGTYRLQAFVTELLQYSPDLITIMVGSNEFLEARHFKNWAGVKASLGRSGILNWKTLALARELLRKAKTTREGHGRQGRILDADALSLPWIDQDLVTSEDEIDAVVDHSERNLTAMIKACKRAGVPVILCTSPSNLRVNSFSGEVTDDSYFGRLYRQAEAYLRSGDPASAIQILEPELEHFNDNYRQGSRIFYLIAGAYSQAGDVARAYDCYVKAKDLDTAVIRTPSAFNHMLADVAAKEQIPLLDVVAVCRKAVPDGIPDDRLFLDNCHFNLEGHILVARAFHDAIRTQLP